MSAEVLGICNLVKAQLKGCANVSDSKKEANDFCGVSFKIMAVG